ncbi:PIG-L family deacetylase [Actinospica sp. MGRD01-02]|uniref:PIG-L family deacetylase n=1 Tax=Actinospica acidithermotolerans TaxID=2828514 RepID=A0A941IP59_9ACTN|nr:PIG-L family deacetylase [Actinospica acidithermotolerans]MBR7830126.1 PIG-L family deacetylase [Actinospica acidithermotolerans]
MATVVAFHAHPDDEALLTGGTLARLVAEGHRVVLVVACDGETGEARPDGGGTRRLDELRASARVLGVSRVVHLGYADSGHGPALHPDPADRARFVSASPDEAAERLAGVLRAEHAEILVGYDPNGGYRHRDHIRVHEVALRAAELADTPRVMEATLPREPILRAYRVVSTLKLAGRHNSAEVRRRFTARNEITHRIDVRRFADKKRAALACHASQGSGRGCSARLHLLMTRLPLPVFGMIFGREYYVEVGTPRGWLD